jgi:cell division septum initiation protein DivIVA
LITIVDHESASCLIVIVQLHSVAVRGSPDSDDLVPLHEPFETAIRGFNRRQVLEHLESLDGRIAIALADRDAALAQVAQLSKALDHMRAQSEVLAHLRRETDKANSEIERILTAPMAEASARILHILKLAEEEAAELKNRAQAEIVASKARADQDIAELRDHAEEQIAELRACAGREAKSLLEHARRQCDRLEEESAARRNAAEQEAAQAIARREADANERIRDRELHGLAGLHFMLRVLGEHLTNREGAVERDESALREFRTRITSEASALETLRTGITAAVVATHKLFAEALEQVRKIPVEHALTEQSSEGQPAVPAQRGTHDSRGYLPNTSTDDRRSPRTPH